MIRLKKVIIAFSLANLCFLPEWAIWLKWTNGYFVAISSLRLQLVTLMVNVILIAIIFLLMLALVKKIDRPKFTRLGQYIFLFFLILPLNAARIMSNLSLGKLLNNHKLLTIASALLLAVVATYIIFKYTAQTVKLVTNLLLILSPFVLFTFGQASWSLIKLHNLSPSIKQTEIIENNDQSTKVLWIIFDELDQRIVFEERPDGLELPEFDKLVAESFFATEARSPATDTKESIPSLLTGKIIKTANQASPNELNIITDTEEKLKWSEQNNIFDKALALGHASAIAGQWYHPYCRIVGNSVSNCKNENTREDIVYKNSLTDLTKLILNKTYQLLPWWRRLSKSQDQMIDGPRLRQAFQTTLENTKKFTLDKDINLIFAHFPVPHNPYFYNRQTDKLTDAHRNPTGYLDGLALADKTLGEIRTELELAGLWNKTTIIVSSDHHWRSSYAFDGIIKKFEVPFILKLPNQTENFTFEEEFNTVLTSQLILEILIGNIRTPTSTNQWLIQNK